MKNRDLADKLRRIISSDLEACGRSIDDKDFNRAASELEDAMNKLKRLVRELE